MRESDQAGRFAAIYQQTRSQVYAYAVTKAGRQLAEEVVSEVFLIAWRRLADLPDPPLPWLLVAVRHVSSNQGRSAARERALAAEFRAWIGEAGLTERDVAEQVIDRMTILSALATLPEPDREVLTLGAWHGLSAGVAARVLGCSSASYFVRLHRARKRLERAVAAAQQEGAHELSEREPGEQERASQNTPAPPADRAGSLGWPWHPGRPSAGGQGFGGCR